MSHFWWGDEDSEEDTLDGLFENMSQKISRMGEFCNIHCFNLAILAKKVWHLLENQESLCTPILKAKYFPDDDLLNTKLKKGSSFTLQSIMVGVNSLNHRYIWRVGNG